MLETQKVTLLGIQIDLLTVDTLHQLLLDVIKRNEKAQVLHVNVHAMNLAYEDQWLHNYFNQAEVVFCDGAGVRLGGKLLGLDIPPRITYADWMWQLAQFGEEEEISFFFLGASPNVANIAAANLRERYPNLKIKGVHHGYFDKELDSEGNSAVVNLINQAKPDVLIIGFGMPIQEKWLCENWPNLEVNIALTGGAVFDYISGELQRAPKWMTNNGLEWLGRVVIEPRRLWRRYIIGNTLFIARVLRHKFGMGPFSS